MAEEVTIGGSGSLFIGEDKVLHLELFLKSDPTVAVDMTGWTMLFDVRLKDASSDPAIVAVTPLSLTGTFNALRTTNTQRALVPLTDDQLNLFKVKAYRWSWKRTDAGSETVLSRGDFVPEKATAP